MPFGGSVSDPACWAIVWRAVLGQDKMLTLGGGRKTAEPSCQVFGSLLHRRALSQSLSSGRSATDHALPFDKQMPNWSGHSGPGYAGCCAGRPAHASPVQQKEPAETCGSLLIALQDANQQCSSATRHSRSVAAIGSQQWELRC